MANAKDEFTIDAIIEIPKGSRNKYEYDRKKQMIRYDRMIFSSMFYPSDYGFIPETLAEDGDEIDVLVLVTEPTFPGCLMEVKPIGLFKMYDEKGTDDKILCVPVSDPIWNKVNALEEVNPHLKMEIEHFFQVYKDLEKKKVGVEGWEDKAAALHAIQDAKKRFQENGIG
ncbi:inorganic pyrophosphatase [Catalinimonas alkaloidigena]|uniref:inorganic diphosphatase n=1 Tax=Catalinimonas alkaloidigena TaxID=1075417 RepID=UPI002404A049|nr:inorganic diphosphatase [Catalinimonas alkaloidigena]MDF9797305.1 inorganic pyrophosphatase [Catalinimonas alkaloidigena]